MTIIIVLKWIQKERKNKLWQMAKEVVHERGPRFHQVYRVKHVSSQEETMLSFTGRIQIIAFKEMFANESGSERISRSAAAARRQR